MLQTLLIHLISLSREGTTQGDPLVMLMYAVSLVPLIQSLSGIVHQVWCADDGVACSSIEEVVVVLIF